MTAGAPLYQIDPARYEAALDRARAALAESQANLTAARLRAERYRGLVAINAVSKQEYDDAEAARQQAEASIAANEAAVRTARIDLGYTLVTSPIAGRAGRSSVTAGALVTANQPQALVTMQQLDPIYVDVAHSSAELLRLRRQLAAGELTSARRGEARVTLLLEDGTRYAHTGRLQFSEVTVDESTGAVTLRAVFPNPRQELLPEGCTCAPSSANTAGAFLDVVASTMLRSACARARILAASMLDSITVVLTAWASIQ